MRSILLVALLAGTVHAQQLAPVCFSPKGGCTAMIVAHINAAKTSLQMQAYSFTSKPIVAALVAAETRGVAVSLILDRSMAKGGVCPAPWPTPRQPSSSMPSM